MLFRSGCFEQSENTHLIKWPYRVGFSFSVQFHVLKKYFLLQSVYIALIGIQFEDIKKLIEYILMTFSAENFRGP